MTIDRRFFLGTLAEACGMTGWRVDAWVLMGIIIICSSRLRNPIWSRA